MDRKIKQDDAPQYDPNNLLDGLHANLRLKNDAQLARMLEVGPPVISKIRHRRLSVGGALLIRMHEVTGLKIDDLRSMMGDRRRKHRVSDVHGRPKVEQVPGAIWPVPAT